MFIVQTADEIWFVNWCSIQTIVLYWVTFYDDLYMPLQTKVMKTEERNTTMWRIGASNWLASPKLLLFDSTWTRERLSFLQEKAAASKKTTRMSTKYAHLHSGFLNKNIVFDPDWVISSGFAGWLLCGKSIVRSNAGHHVRPGGVDRQATVGICLLWQPSRSHLPSRRQRRRLHRRQWIVRQRQRQEP